MDIECEEDDDEEDEKEGGVEESKLREFAIRSENSVTREVEEEDVEDVDEVEDEDASEKLPGSTQRLEDDSSIKNLYLSKL